MNDAILALIEETRQRLNHIEALAVVQRSLDDKNAALTASVDRLTQENAQLRRLVRKNWTDGINEYMRVKEILE